MTNILKNAFAQAEKEQNEKKEKAFKEIIFETLQKLDAKQKEQKEIVKEIQILKADIKNFKEGRLDLIEERQDKDELAKKVSVVKVKQGEIVEDVPIWQIDYVINYQDSTWHFTNGFCRNNTSGTYCLANQNIKYI